jgi:hypothetical protein
MLVQRFLGSAITAAYRRPLLSTTGVLAVAAVFLPPFNVRHGRSITSAGAPPDALLSWVPTHRPEVLPVWRTMPLARYVFVLCSGWRSSLRSLDRQERGRMERRAE